MIILKWVMPYAAHQTKIWLEWENLNIMTWLRMEESTEHKIKLIQTSSNNSYFFQERPSIIDISSKISKFKANKHSVADQLIYLDVAVTKTRRLMILIQIQCHRIDMIYIAVKARRQTLIFQLKIMKINFIEIETWGQIT